MGILDNFLGGGSDPDTERREEWLNENHGGSPPAGNNLEPLSSDAGNTSGDVSGEGGVVGPISAAIGDIALGGSASADGDNSFEFGDVSFGDGPSLSKGLSAWHIGVVGLVALVALKITRGK